MAAKESFEWIADWAEGVAPLYERLARQTAEDETLLDIGAESMEGQPASNLLFGAVHALLLEGQEHPLAEFYSTCRENPADPEATDPFPAFRDFCLTHEERLREIVSSRRVQTNAVGRSAVLFPAFKHVVDRRSDSPLALVEIGSSAGLNLCWDQFRYEYEDYGAYGDPSSPVHIETAVKGETTPPFWESEPEIVERVGIDINPLDITNEEDARWLRALVMPDQEWRFERLDAAIELAASNPPELVEGDALERLPEILADIPAEYDVCVFSTLVMYQLNEEQIEELRDILQRQGRDRTVHWLSNDPSQETDRPLYRHVSFEEGMETQNLAEYKAHGEWIRWLAGDSSQ